MLSDEIEKAQHLVKTDAFTMSIGEIVSMYDDSEIVVDPEFQRLFRWNSSQKSKLIESILLGIPIPSIFVFEKDDGKWELIDGLQRISTILEFMGKLKNPDGGLMPPSILEATKHLPSLHNTVWERSEKIIDLPLDEQVPLEKPFQLTIRRSRLSVEILKRPSNEQTKFELFQRLNAGGTQANAQELRNCIILMVNKDYFRSIKILAEGEDFKSVISVTEDQIERQRHLELMTRFLVHTYIPYDGTLDVEEYIDNGIVELATNNDINNNIECISLTFSLLNKIAGRDSLRRYDNGHYSGRVGLVGLEVIAVGIAKNITAISEMKNSEEFVLQKSRDFWSQPELENFTSPGLRGTIRIQRTVPFGEKWFKP
ncbi:MAG: DUF262 domain-containing protein [Asticcacaulis sp.]|uniref:DUF262 domain-containing protein n=1 Tax=Asticcacaulis sp. TaxID=1872648 RepID=UPI003F7CC2DB